MVNIFSGAIASIRSFFNQFQVKRFLAVVLVGFLFLTSGITSGQDDAVKSERTRQWIHQGEGNDQRPKTTGEWMNEARQDAPLGERIQQIGEDSAEAFKEFGSGYVEGAKKTARGIRDSAAQAGDDLVQPAR